MDTMQCDRAVDVDCYAKLAFRPEINDLCESVAQKDFAFFSARKTKSLLSAQDPDLMSDWPAFQESWNRLEQDLYMKDGGTYRFRRHATYSATPASSNPKLESHQPHYQSLDYNNLNGGIARHFAPIEPGIVNNKVLNAALELCCESFGRLAPYYTWHIEVHQFRINASQLEVSPTPEGIHRDGVSFVFMMLVNRVNVVNGETAIYDRNKSPLSRYTLASEMEAAIVNDERVMHGVTPIVQLDLDQPAYRDVLVITFSKR
ncbi:2OG-Fe dioxygenase family protein [Pseudomonas gingeri]|uniref:2OG-Fe dioxygenase family protein n=1 Tax=Pseudomonas gingeri TaxID=117681 RepID=UPI0015A03A1C|nr:2OG-Fe dioxygenase family protein [Pseudomonas gingeri]NWD70606.1 2OG-Fe dioxygenase family protein [Pseudomonas gingeri]